MKFFISSSWANMKSVQLLTENLSALSHEVFSYVNDERNFVTKKELDHNHLEEGKGEEHDTEVQQAYEKDIEGLRSSDTFIMLLPAGNSSHITAGIAFALNKQTILVGTPKEAETHYLIFNERYKTIGDYVASIKSKK